MADFLSQAARLGGSVRSRSGNDSGGSRSLHGEDYTGRPRPFESAAQLRRRGGLFADDGGLGSGDFKAHEAVIRVEIQGEFDVGGLNG